MPLIITPFDQLGTQLKKIQREAKGMSQQELAKKTKYSEQHISGLFRGKVPFTQDSIERLAAAMGIKMQVVIALDDNDLRRLLEANF